MQVVKKVYLDYASTTPIDLAVRKVMEPYFGEKFGNAGAMHRWGQEAQAAVDESRQKIADFFGCAFEEIIFTGSATESNNLAIRGVVKRAQQNVGFTKSHIITSLIEHKSVLETCRGLEKESVEVTYLPVTKGGFVRPEDVEAAIKENTVLISIMYVNNEIGTIQPVREIFEAIKNVRRNLPPLNPPLSKGGIEGGSAVYPFFHTDAVQALNYLDCNVKKLGVDLLTFSGHKVYGPKGIGGLYVKKDTLIATIITGGNQESGLRSGTENVSYIVGFAKAVEIAAKGKDKEAKRMQKLRDYFIDEVLKKIPYAELNGSRQNRIANNANFLFRGVPVHTLLIALDQEGIAASAGSTCAIKTVTPSEVLLAIGRSSEEAKQSIRFTLGRGTTKKGIDYTISILGELVKRKFDIKQGMC